ncbi:class II histocompatibility antigen, M alpha chain isoform X2 [Rhea pennata]|uniref:class II histocompatibility antigen, M alpha chain isoform X2 n=1 Tax=Rhea pennata TaxID=8795 RepID=UPI002E26A77A
MGAAGGCTALAAALLWGALAVAGPDEPVAHVLQEVLFCQPDLPSLGLTLTFDGDELFSYDFPSARWLPRLPELPPAPAALGSPAALLRDADFCQHLRRWLSTIAQGVLPESKGIPMVDVFAARPLQLGRPNTLVCMVGNVFPAAASVSWQRGDGASAGAAVITGYAPAGDFTFLLFSYLPVTPRRGDVYACTVTRSRENVSVVAYWVAQHAVPSEVLETALGAAAAALGVLLALLGGVLLLAARRRRRRRSYD